MGPNLRVEHVVADRCSVAEAAAFYRSVRGHGSEDRFRWFYLDNPAGRAHLFFLRTAAGELRGMSNAIPARIQIGGQPHTAWNTVDFCLDPQCRTLGPALKLRRGLFEAAREHGVAAVYYYPAAQFRPLHERVGTDGIWWNVQLRIPVVWRDFARKMADQARALRPVAHTVLACTGWMSGTSAEHFSHRAYACEWDELRSALTQIAERASATRATFGCSWAWLSWRFRDCPVYPCRPFLIIDRQGPTALAVVASVGEASWLKLFWPPVPAPPVLRALLSAIRRAGALAPDGLLRAVAVEDHWLVRLCPTCRVFSARDDSITVLRRTNDAARSLPEPMQWDMLISDRDL